MTPEELEEVQRLLKAARSDMRAAEALAADAEQDDDVVGFHAQQAVEKYYGWPRSGDQVAERVSAHRAPALQLLVWSSRSGQCHRKICPS